MTDSVVLRAAVVASALFVPASLGAQSVETRLERAAEGIEGAVNLSTFRSSFGHEFVHVPRFTFEMGLGLAALICFLTAALREAVRLAKEVENGAVVWVHGPQPVELGQAETIRQF